LSGFEIDTSRPAATIVSFGVFGRIPRVYQGEFMVLNKSELLASLQHEVRILLHLAGKVEPHMRDYRPTPKQRSALELLKYMSIMGPGLIRAAKAGRFDPAAWTVEEKKAAAYSFDEAVAAIAAQRDEYAALLDAISDAEMREEIEMFGRKQIRGPFIVNLVLGGHAAYRTQLFLYLKSCGREELGTMNLWAGADAPAATA
jgi:hypothetical protein